MKADLTRDTFDPFNHFRRVLHQQGRVTLDADPNEQTAILLHYLEALARDLIGPYGAPAGAGGFALTLADGDLLIGAGNYYVDGILVENDTVCSYAAQPAWQAAADDPLVKELRQPSGKTFWAYLDVWERHVSWIDHPALLEPALNGVDTCTRSQLVWQVRALAIDTAEDDAVRVKLAALSKQQQTLMQDLAKATAPAKIASIEAKLKAVSEQIEQLQGEPGAAPARTCAGPLELLSGLGAASLAARVDPGAAVEDACTIAPDAQYRGPENQLYRVEIHRSGAAGTATFKWARDNGSVAAAWLGAQGTALQVSGTHGFEAGNWVELAHEGLDLRGEPGTLARVASVDNGALVLDPGNASTLAWTTQLANPTVRRWDQTQIGDIVLDGGAVPIVESTGTVANWITLEDGIQVAFAEGGVYRSGDYWLIPARVATGSIVWPQENGAPAWQAPAGILHHYAPLGYIGTTEGQLAVNTCRCEFAPLAICP